MPLLTLNGVSLAYGLHPLLDQVDLSIDAGERVCLVGRNGSGKSTLLKVIAGVAQTDDGEVWRRDTLRISHLEQEVPSDSEDTVYDVVASGLGELGALLAEYHGLATRLAAGQDDAGLQRLAVLQQRIEALDGWSVDNRIATRCRLIVSLPNARAACAAGPCWRGRWSAIPICCC
jgi:ATP-binding cassette subfamily F protein uup